MHFNIATNYEQWRTWALSNGISDRIISYLAFDNSRLCMEPESSDLAFCTPRSWAYVSTLLKACGDNPEQIHDLIAACVGNDSAIEFEAFCKGYIDLPSIENIMIGKCKETPRSHDVMYALITSLVSFLIEKGSEISIDELNNICDYVLKLPNDFCMSFMNDIRKIEGLNMRLMKCVSFQNWFSKNKKFI